MFHKFSATPAKAGKGSASARVNNNKNNTDSNPVAKRQKIARACDRCRQRRIKCDEQKPCTQCVGVKAKCIVSYLPPPSSQANNDTDPTRYESSSSARPGSNNGSSTANTNPTRPSAPPSRIGMSVDSSWANVRNKKENVDPASHIQGFFATGQPAFSRTSAITGCNFPQLPYPVIPSGERAPASITLLENQRSYYLRLFWDVCHPLLQIISEKDFADLVARPPPAMTDEYSAKRALVDSMIALGIQHSHATGISGRILGLQQPPSPEVTWPGFEYFHRARECMRATTETTLEALQCHTLMALYLMKGNAFQDAYDLLGITVRRAYIVQLHRLPPSHLPEAGRTARMQLWWMLFSLDLQCSLQLGMPAACQKSLVKCSFPAEAALARYVSPSSHYEGINACTYSIHLAKLAVIVTDIGACVSIADLVDDSNGPAALEHHALMLFSSLRSLEVWRDQLPSGLVLSRRTNSSDNTEIDFDCDPALPAWLQRQMVLLELHYHNAYTLIQRPFIRLAGSSNEASGNIIPSDSQQPHVGLHIGSAIHHAITIVDMIFNVCSKSDILYGWSEILQPLWNAALTIISYVYANSLSPMVPHALDSLMRTHAVFKSFSPTYPTAASANFIVESLTDSLHGMVALASGGVSNDLPP